jgi:hypothetical protein
MLSCQFRLLIGALPTREFMQEGVMAIAASLTQLSSMTMVSVSNYIMVGSLLSVELCAVT